MAEFTISLSGSLTKATTTGKQLLPYDLSFGVGSLTASDAFELRIPISTTHVMDLSSMSFVQVLYMTTDQDITVNLGGSVSPITLSAGGQLVLVGAQITGVSITTGSIAVTNVSIYMAGAASSLE